MNKKSFLRVDNLTKTFGDLEVIRGASVTFAQRETYAITGSSGAGKSTFLHILAGLDQPTSGSIFFNTTDISHLTTKKRSAFLNATVGLVFQNPYLIQELSVLENIMIPGLIAGKAPDECRQKAVALLEKIHLVDKKDACPARLSGGQQQRIAILRALFNEPDFLLADEPTGNLDEKTGTHIVDFLLECQQQWGMGMIISSHDAYVAQSMKHVFKLIDGCLV